MQRYFLDCNDQLSSDDIHHIIHVMRFKSDTQVEVCSAQSCHLATLHIDNKSVTFTLGESIPNNPPLNITIIQGLPKGDKMDTVTKYATLFQAKTILFMPMKRSIAKLSNVDHKLSRLHKIAKEAAELSKRSTVPHIDFIKEISDLNLDGKQLILLDELEQENTIKYLESIDINQELVIIIGPEGGIDNDERQAFIEIGAKTLSLGKSILPTELAHIPILNACLLKKL